MNHYRRFNSSWFDWLHMLEKQSIERTNFLAAYIKDLIKLRDANMNYIFADLNKIYFK